MDAEATAASDALLIGVDGGGSKTAVRLARVAGDDLELLGEGFAGPSNVRAVGIEHATTNLDVAADAAFAGAGLSPVAVRVAVLALAGSSLTDVQAAVHDWAGRRGLAAQVEIVHDADPVLAESAVDGQGVALIVGTGSVAVAEDGKGGRAMAGGWGYWFGDAGSGYDLGRQGLRALAEAEDGLGPATGLRERVLERLGIEVPREILLKLGGRVDMHREIAALARVVLDAAGDGDAVASGIVDEAVADSAGLVVAAARKLGLENGAPLGLAGGVGASSRLYRERLVAALRQAGFESAPVTVVTEPVTGSLRLAQRLMERRA